MKIKSAKSFRYWFKTKIKEIEGNDRTQNEDFVGTYHREDGKKTIKGFFEMYHGYTPDIPTFLPSILKIAEDGQAIYEFLQNAVDCGSTHFYIFYNEIYFLAINNGSPFDKDGLKSILNIAQTTKKDPDKIGRLGIGFKLAHRLVGRNEGTDELVNQYKGPVLFSWSKLEDLESLLNDEIIEPIYPQKGVNNGFFEAPYLLKILLTNFPSDPNETVKDINYKDQVLFKQEELKELIDFLNENFKIHSDSLKKNVLKQGSLFFIKLGEDKKKLLDKDYSELVNGIQYSMNTLKNLHKVYINNDDIGKIPLQLEAGTIKKGSDEFERISPEYKEFDIKFAIGFNTIKFGNEKSYEQIKLLKEKPNFYKYFPMGDEINGFSFIVHCDSFSNEANRRKLHEDDINRNLFPELAKHIIQRLTEYKTEDKSKFLNLYASLLLSDIPDRQNNKWLRPIFYDTLLSFLQKNVPTKNGFSDDAQNVKINKINPNLNLDLANFGLSDIQWFEWDNEADKLLIYEATKSEKLGIEEWDIRDIIENANLHKLNSWISNTDDKTYHKFLNELAESSLRITTLIKLCNVKLFKFSDGELYSLYEITGCIINRFDGNTGNYRYYNSGEIKPNYIFHTHKTNNIDSELKKLDFILCDLEISKYINKLFDHKSIYYFNHLQTEKSVYNRIADNCKKNTLLPREKEKLFLNFINEETKFENVDDETLKDLHLFCDSLGNIKPLSELVSSSLQTSAWLFSYKIKSDEYFKDLNSYLIQGDELFDEIILPNIEVIKDELTEAKEIKEFVTFFKENHRPFFNEYIIQKQAKGYAIIDKSDKHQIVPPNKATREFIDKHLSDNLIVLPNDFSDFNNEDGIIKGESLHSIILDLVDVDEHKEILVNIAHYKEEKIILLQKLSEIRLVSKEQYEKESYEYKVLKLACEVINENDILNFKEKIIIETEDTELSLSEIPPFTDKIKIEDYELNLAKLLPDNYKNSDHLSSLINQFTELGLSKERIGNLFGISEEPELSYIFQLFSEQVETLENAEQLAFVILYNKRIEEIDLKTFKVLAKGGGEYDLTYNFYTKQYSFIKDDGALDDKYKGIKEILKKLPFEISDENQIIEEPYFLEENFICPDIITENLTDEQKLSLIDFLFNQWNKKNKKTAIKNINWSKIDDTETVNILGFNPINSVYPSKYACESESLPDYLIKWLSKEESKIDFLTDLGVWTEKSVIVELRKYLYGKINDFQNKRLSQETRFNANEANLFNSFEWLNEKGIKLKTAEQFETFKKAVAVINDNRGNNNDLRVEEEFDFEELEENATEWKSIGDFSIYLYKGALPRIVKLDEIQDYIFYRYSEGDYAVNGMNIYLNENEDKTKTLQKVALDSNNSFTSEDSKDIELSEVKAELEKLKGIINPPPPTTDSYLDEVNEFISELERTEWNDYVPELKNILELSVSQPKEKQKLFNLIAKIKLTKEKNVRFEDSDESFNVVKIGNEKYYVHSARGAFAYIHPIEILKMKDEGYKMALDFNTKSRIKIYETAEEILQLNTNHILVYQYEKTMEELFAFCEANREANKHLLIIDKNNASEKSRALLKLLNIEDDYQ